MSRSTTAALILLCFLFFTGMGAGQAMAAFDNEDLYLTVYNNTTTNGDTEFGFDTGFNLNDFNWNTTFSYSVNTGLSLSLFHDAGNGWADLQAGIYGYDQVTPTTGYGRAYAATTAQDTILNYNGRTGFLAAINGTKTTYQTVVTGNTALLANNLTGNGYDDQMNLNNDSEGIYANLNSTRATGGEANLAVFADPAGAITMYLYGVKQDAFQDPTKGPINNGAYLATITLDANGTLTIASNPVPVPGAVWMLGSGLLGLLGLRRKNA
jgi:hypothetical protein